MKKQRNINLNDVNNTQIINHQGLFTWSFNDYRKNVQVNIKFNRWWINHLAKNLWEIINDEKNELDKLSNNMRGY